MDTAIVSKILKTTTIPISYSAFLLFQQTITMQISTKTSWLLSLQTHVPRFFWKKCIHSRTAILTTPSQTPVSTPRQTLYFHISVSGKWR